jgi:hypothetical protein
MQCKRVADKSKVDRYKEENFSGNDRKHSSKQEARQGGSRDDDRSKRPSSDRRENKEDSRVDGHRRHADKDGLDSKLKRRDERGEERLERDGDYKRGSSEYDSKHGKTQSDRKRKQQDDRCALFCFLILILLYRISQFCWS